MNTSNKSDDSTPNSDESSSQRYEKETVCSVINESLNVLNECEGADFPIHDVGEVPSVEIEDDYDHTLHDPDFEPPGESGDSSSDNNDVIDHEEVVESEAHVAPKRRKGESKNKKKIAKRLRMEGKSYQGMRKVDGKWGLYVDKAERILTPSNCSKQCEKSATKQCTRISETDRKEIFSGFWSNMTWNERKVYVSSLVASGTVTTKTVVDSRRSRSYKYFLRLNEERICVCKRMFLSTLGIGEKTAYGWVDNANSGIPEKPESSEGCKRAQAERHGELRESVRTFLVSLPKMESHYCQASTNKLYLEPVFDTFSALYKEYKTQCSDKEASRRMFEEVFSEMNLALYKPKKDQWDICCGHEVGAISDEVFNAHQQRKQEARAEKERDKEMALSDSTVRVITMDLQSVLLSPKLNASALYYKSKLACHNFMIYDMKTRDITCYFWHECQGDLTANSFATCIANYIETVVSKDNAIQKVILYSDGCGYQNRNTTLANTLCHISRKNGIEITQKFLKKGHTQMEVDWVHSVVKRKIKDTNIYVPQNYVDAISAARPNQPYTVHYVDNSFFRQYSDLQYYSSIRPGIKVGDPVVTDLRVIHYYTNGVVQCKLTIGGEFMDLPRKSRISDYTYLHEEPARLHDGPLKIMATKYAHLQALKSVIPGDFHGFYDNLNN